MISLTSLQAMLAHLARGSVAARNGPDAGQMFSSMNGKTSGEHAEIKGKKEENR
jgi:hypothetical protein